MLMSRKFLIYWLVIFLMINIVQMLHLKGDVGVTGAVRRSSSTDADNKLRGRELLERAARQGNSRAPAQLQVL